SRKHDRHGGVRLCAPLWRSVARYGRLDERGQAQVARAHRRRPGKVSGSVVDAVFGGERGQAGAEGRGRIARMLLFILGIVVFFGVHSVRIVADDWRTRQVAQRGEQRWKGLYSLASLVGIVMLGWGYALTRRDPIELWSPPAWTRPITSV